MIVLVIVSDLIDVDDDSEPELFQQQLQMLMHSPRYQH